MAEPTEVERMRHAFSTNWLQYSESVKELDALIAAVLAEALAEPTNREFGRLAVEMAKNTKNLNFAVVTLSIAAYRRLRGAK